MNIVEELRSAVASGAMPRPLIVCGAGVSTALTGGAAPIWRALIEDGVRQAAGLDMTLSAKRWGEATLAKLARAGADEWIELADEVAERLGGGHDAEFRGWLESSVGRLACTNRFLADATTRRSAESSAFVIQLQMQRSFSLTANSNAAGGLS